MGKLKDNQILITLEENGNAKVKVGVLPEIEYSGCPDKPFEQLQNSINSYVKEFDLANRSESFKSKGCWFKNTGKCLDCL